MTSDLTTRTASRVVAVAVAEQYLADRAAAVRHGRDGSWRNPDVRDMFIVALTATRFTVADNTVTGHAARINGGVWAYLAKEALAVAYPGAIITRTDRYTFTLTLD